MTNEKVLNETTTIRFARTSEKEVAINEFIHDYPKEYSNRSRFAKELLMIGYEAYTKGITTSKGMELFNLSSGSSQNVESVQPLLDVIESLRSEIKELKTSLSEATRNDDNSTNNLLNEIKTMLENGVVTTKQANSVGGIEEVPPIEETAEETEEEQDKPKEIIISADEQDSALNMIDNFGVFD